MQNILLSSEERARFSALILCGGRSSRMGRDKTLLQLGGQSLLDRAAAFWRPLCREVLLAAGSQAHFRAGDLPDGVRQVFDPLPNCGPLGGLCAGLAAMKTEYLFVSAVDMPFLDPEAAASLMAAVRGHEAAAYRLHGRPEPLFAVYAKSCLPVAQALLETSQFKVGLVLRRCESVCLDTDRDGLFFNVNTPDAFLQAQTQLEAAP